MIKIENAIFPSPEQMEAVVRGTRNPLNSWNKSDSYLTYFDEDYKQDKPSEFFLGEKDEDLLKRLSNHSEERKFARMLPVIVDITAPLYWWKQFDTYKIGTTSNSCSTMHKLTEKKFEMSDFSFTVTDETIEKIFVAIIELLNSYRNRYIETKDKKYWQTIVELLPEAYMQKRTISLNYEVLGNMYRQRKHHKLGEWRIFCDWITTIPYEYIVLNEEQK